MMEELNHTQGRWLSVWAKKEVPLLVYPVYLSYPPDIQLAVRNGTMSIGHAALLINVDTVDKQLYIFLMRCIRD